jgi:hypothetical protein
MREGAFLITQKIGPSAMAEPLGDLPRGDPHRRHDGSTQVKVQAGGRPQDGDRRRDRAGPAEHRRGNGDSKGP